MNYVEPIRDEYTVRSIKSRLKETNQRNYVMFLLGISTGLRISDIIKLRVEDVSKDSITMRENKTRKQKIIPLNDELRLALKKYIDKEGLALHDYLIKSNKGENKPITRERAYQIMQDIGKQFRINNLGTHSLRKTFGYHYYQQTKDVVLLQQLFNHADPSITLRYIGITQGQMNEAIKNFKI